MCRIIWVFAVLGYGRDISHIAVLFFFSKQSSPDQAVHADVQAHMGIRYSRVG